MGAPKENAYWKLRKTHGRNAKYDSPDKLWEKACEYMMWLEENPLEEEKVFHNKGEIVKCTVNKMRASTLTGFCLFADISLETFSNYKKNEDLFGVTKTIEDMLKTQKFEGAAAELLNPNIIARDLGLGDKLDHTTDGEKMKAVMVFGGKEIEV